MNKQDLINRLVAGMAQDCPMTRAKAENALDLVFGGINEALAQDESVRIAGFGTFRRTETKPRTARNPRTGELVDVPAKHKIKFKAAAGAAKE